MKLPLILGRKRGQWEDLTSAASVMRGKFAVRFTAECCCEKEIPSN